MRKLKPATSFLYWFCLCAGLATTAVCPAWSQDTVPPNVPNGQVTLPNSELVKYEGKTVSDIRFEGITGTNPAMLRNLMTQRTGQPLEGEKLGQSIKSLYATGRFATLQVDGR